MSKNRQDKIDRLAAQIAEQQEQLRLERKKQAEEQRKAKDARQKRRHGLLESMLPDTVGLTDEQYKTFLERHVTNEHGRKALANILSQATIKPAEKQETVSAHHKQDATQKAASEMQASSTTPS